jgi:hypothetical protein
MKNLIFLLWMLLFPLVEAIVLFLRYKYHTYNEDDKVENGMVAIWSLINLIVYYYVATLLYEH